jgi:DNA-binding CsgD family transcriptional regulator
MALGERDVRLALGIVEAAAATANGAPFGHELLDALGEAIPVDGAEYIEWPFHEKPFLYLSSPCNLWADQPEEEAREVMAVACRTYPLRDKDLASFPEPLRITDRVSTLAFRRTAFYTLMMRPFGVEHELKLWLPAPQRQSYCFSLIRSPGRDFGDRDVALLRLVRPHLARLRARWERAPRPAQLTERETDVLELVAKGLTNREVAARLFISTGTVRTHLEHVYEKLGVRTRAGAVAAAFRITS